MALKCGIIGITNVGKTSLFNCISNTKAETTNFAFSTNKSNIGMVTVPDPRLYELEKHQETEKIIPTAIEIVDIPGLAKGASEGERIGNKFLEDIRQTDAIIHVLRCFDDENLPHIEGSIDPVRDKEILDFELQVADLVLVEKKIERVKKRAAVGEKEAKRELELLNAYKNHFENFKPARTIDLSDEEKLVVKELNLLSEKPQIYVCNVEDEAAVEGNEYVTKLKASLQEDEAEILVIAGKLEAEIAELESMDDRLAFLEDSGLSEPGVNKVIRAAYAILDLQTFFTVGPKEIRAWTVRKNSTAPQAAGVIHSDLQRGFIRAEVMKYDDFISLGSENACKQAGKFAVEGKNYIVQDGDILHIRFNV
jgi:GTP-binding protein YchF